MTVSPEWLPSLDTDTAASVIEDGLETLAGAAGPAATAGLGLASLSGPALLLLGSVAAPIAEAKTVELSKKADLRLQQYIEETDGDERAYLRKLAVGASTLLPDSDELNQAAVDAARGDPARFRDLLDEYTGDREAELEKTVDRILRGTVDRLDETLCEAFGTENVDEAQALFMDLRDVVESRRVHETFERVLDIEGQLAGVADELAETRGEMHERFKELRRTALRNEGFVRLSPAHFAGEVEDPQTAWRAGFSLRHVRAGLAVDRESRQDPDRTISEELLASLTAGRNRLVVGSAGSGKSVVCKSVACEWYDRRETGPVLYRRSGQGGEPFRSVGTLISAIRGSEGRTLVVVEDALGPDSERIFEVIDQVSDDAASFLLDTRPTEQLEQVTPDGRRVAHTTADTAQQGSVGLGTVGTDIHGSIVDEFRRLASERYDFPSMPSVTEVEAVFESFERTTGRTVDTSAAAARRSIETAADIGGMLLLSYHLPFRDVPTEGLGADVTEKYDVIGGRAAVPDRVSELTAIDVDLRQDVAVMIALLVASGLGNEPELVHSLVEKHAQHGDDDAYLEVHERIRDVRRAFRNWFIFEADDDAEVQWTTHERWAVMYLQRLGDDAVDGGSADSRLRLGRTNRFLDCIDALFTIVTDDARRQELLGVFPDSEVLSRIDEDPQSFAGSATRAILEIGRTRPALYPLYDFDGDHGLRIDPDWPDETRAAVRRQMGSICAAYGETETAREYLEDSRTLYEQLDDTERLAEVVTQLGELAMSASEHETARDLFRRGQRLYSELDDRRGVAYVLTNLGRVARLERNLDLAHEFFRKAQALYRELDEASGIAVSLNNLGALERERDNHDAAREHLEEAYDVIADLGDRATLALCLSNLGALEHDQGRHDRAREYLLRAYDIFTELGHREPVATILLNLGAVELTSGHPERARGYLLESRDLCADLDHQWGVAYTLGSLGVAARHVEEYDEAFEYLADARERYRQIDHDEGVAMSLRDSGWVAQSVGDLDRARDFLTDALEQFESLGADSAVQETFDSLIDLCEADGDTDAAVEWCNRAKKWARAADVDSDGVVSHFLVREYGLRATEETTETLFTVGVSQVPAQLDPNPGVGFDVRPFEYLWERRDDFEPGEDAHFYIMSSGVFLVAIARVIDESTKIDTEAVLETVEREAPRLTSGASVLFEHLTTGSTETTPETLTRRAQRKESRGAQADLIAAGYLLAQLTAD